MPSKMTTMRRRRRERRMIKKRVERWRRRRMRNIKTRWVHVGSSGVEGVQMRDG